MEKSEGMINPVCHCTGFMLLVLITTGFIGNSFSFKTYYFYDLPSHQKSNVAFLHRTNGHAQNYGLQPLNTKHHSLTSSSSSFLHTCSPKDKRMKYSRSLALFVSKKTSSYYAKVPTRTTQTKTKTPRKTKAKRVSTKKKKQTKFNNGDQIEPVYFWGNHTDELTWKNSSFFYSTTRNNDNNHTVNFEKLVRFVIRGNPIPLARHRSYRGYQFNPSAKKQEQFKDVFINMTKPTNIGKSLLLFPEGDYIAATILFRMKRPKNHFISGKPGAGRLRPKSPEFLHPTRSDVDNLAKFVLDAFNGVLYSDDRQIVRLCSTKVLDSEENCTGATEVIFHSVQDYDMFELLNYKTSPTYIENSMKY